MNTHSENLFDTLYMEIKHVQKISFGQNKCDKKYTLSEAATGGVLRNFEKLTGKHLCQSLFFPLM